MRSTRFRVQSSVITIALLLPGAAIVADGAPAPPENAPSRSSGESAQGDPRKEKLEFFQRRLRGHRLTFADRPEEPFRFVEDAVIQFDNPISGIHDGFLFLWTDRGRPIVLLKSYYNQPRGSWGRTFVSLATRPIELRIGDAETWFPKEGAVQFAPLPSASAPSDSPRLRLAQMRSIARQFKVVDRWGLQNPTDWQLRLLTAPLYRYEVPDEKVIDGALFGYALTTSPEAVVLIEAKETDDGLQWQYAVSRSTRFGITFSIDGRVLAEFPRLEAWPPTGTYFHIAEPMPDYPFEIDR